MFATEQRKVADAGRAQPTVHHREFALRLVRDLALLALLVHSLNMVSVLVVGSWTPFCTAELLSAVMAGLVLGVGRWGGDRWRGRMVSALVITVVARWCVSWASGDPHLIYTSTISGLLYLPFLVPISLLLGARAQELMVVAAVVAGVAMAGSGRLALADSVVANWRLGPAVFTTIGLLAIYARRWMRHLDALRSSELRAHQLSMELQAATARELATRMETVTQIGGALAHELNNLLAVVQPLSAGLAEQLEGELQDDARDILRSSQRLEELGQQFRLLTQQHGAGHDPTDLLSVLRAHVAERRAAGHAGLSLVVAQLDGAATVAASAEELRTLVAELTANALEASPAGGPVEITVSLQEGESPATGMLVQLQVDDRGHGIDAQMLETVMHPFVSTRPEAGRGLGLTTALAVVLRAGGRLEVENRRGGGVRARALLPTERPRPSSPTASSTRPSARPTPPPPRAPGSPRTPAKRRPHAALQVLLVDDEPMVLRSTSRILRRQGLSVTAHGTSHAALDSLMDEPDRYDIVISDVQMPAMSGPELAAAARERLAEPPPFLYITGYVDPLAVGRLGVEADAERVLHKPFSGAELLARIHGILGVDDSASG